MTADLKCPTNIVLKCVQLVGNDVRPHNDFTKGVLFTW